MKNRKLTFILLPVIITGIFSIIVGIITKYEKAPPPIGKILAPSDNSEINSEIDCLIEVKNKSKMYVWAAIKDGYNFWPKFEIPYREGRFVEKFYESRNSGEELQLVLFVVKKQEHKRIKNWLLQGSNVDSFPALKNIKITAYLDIVRLKHK